MSVAQSDIDTLRTLINTDGTQPAGAKGQAEELLYSLSVLLFPAVTPTMDGSTPSSQMTG